MKLLLRLYSVAKSLHRLSLFAMIALTLVMATTGTAMKYSQLVALFPKLDLSLVRFIHNELSPFFSVVLGIMMMSGSYMYWFPWYNQRRAAVMKKSDSTKSVVSPVITSL